MGLESWSILYRLRKAVKKIRFLLNFDISKLKIASMMIGAKRMSLSFNDRPGLRGCIEDSNSNNSRDSPAKTLQRTISYPSSSSSDDHHHQQDDIDKRADLFIANFYKQLQLERQISLELRYARGNSFSSSSSP
ncbi:hypothetical protein M9H77_06321 [Catharanthus roseus]|uniref:Uncharacterized protein n=1 Tax=Catharanthus roseus TaxID=4058 RepID=A0ACC0BRZ5_CATRO|nr:hypothetical protein M9H77_06321 [Catharanthus roseus]